MPPAPGQKVFMLAMTDYFSKWIEAEAFRQVTSKEVISFIKRNILCKFGIPSKILCDNGSQFISDKTEAFCRNYNISLIKSTPRYPQANVQAESSNKIIINNLKKRLTTHKGRWQRIATGPMVRQDNTKDLNRSNAIQSCLWD